MATASEPGEEEDEPIPGGEPTSERSIKTDWSKEIAIVGGVAILIYVVATGGSGAWTLAFAF